MKMKYKRIMAAGMVFVMLCTGTGSAPVYGAQPSVDVDETMYVNLDYYGRVDKINVVKGVGLNGQTEFTDYGTYENVINMSNSIEPVLGDGMVTWQLPEDQRGRFYFKCAVDKGMMVLPWDFDVSYKLNGVPMDGDKLAGASGLIEINVKAESNDNAGEYYRNNMMLMVAVPVDMSKCYSVEAEGSQTQNLGETTAVVFTALPGEDGDYTVRIGTDSFETIGVIMAMVPGTVEDLEHIKDLKEAKDTWQDAGDELYDSLEQMAKSVENMRQGVNQVRQGMDSAESARQKWSNSKDSILAGNDQTLAALTSVSQQMDTMIPHLQTAKDCAEVVHSSMNDIVNTLGDMQDPLRKLQTRLKNIENSAGGISSDLPELQKTMESIIALDTQLQASQDTLLTYLSLYKSSSTKARRLYDEELDEEELENMEDVDYGTSNGGSHSSSGGGSSQENTQNNNQGNDQGSGNSSGNSGSNTPDTGTAISSAINTGNTGLAGMAATASIEKKNIPLVSSIDQQAAAEAAIAIEQSLYDKVAVLQDLSARSKSLTDKMANLMDDTSDSAKYSAEIVDNTDYLIEDLKALNDSLDVYYPDLQTALDDSQELVRRTTDALNNGISTLTIIQNTLKDSSDDFDAAARDSLRGSMELLDKSLNILDSTTVMRQAGRTMKDTIDNELDKFDTDNRFLFMDPSADKVSFTSDRNKPPKTLQIVMRTDEISVDDDTAKTADAEVEKAKESPLRRMWNVLVQMWKAMVSIFKNR